MYTDNMYNRINPYCILSLTYLCPYALWANFHVILQTWVGHLASFKARLSPYPLQQECTHIVLNQNSDKLLDKGLTIGRLCSAYRAGVRSVHLLKILVTGPHSPVLVL